MEERYRAKDLIWKIPFGSVSWGSVSWEAAAQVAILQDIRDELKRLNCALAQALTATAAHAKPKRRKRKA